MKINSPYLLFLGDAADALAAKVWTIAMQIAVLTI